MANQTFSGQVTALSATAENLTDGWDFDSNARYVEKGSTFLDTEDVIIDADGSTDPEVTFENFNMYFDGGSDTSVNINNTAGQWRVDDPNYSDYACTFSQGSMVYFFTDSNNDKGTGNTWFESQVFRYNGTAPSGPVQGLLRKDFQFIDFNFLNRQLAPESAFGGNALEERYRLERCTLDFRNSNTNSGNIGVPFFGSGVTMIDSKVIKADDAYGDAAIFISNPTEVTGLTVDGGFLKNEHGASGTYFGVSFQGAGTNGVLNHPCQYYQRGNTDIEDGGETDRMLRLVDCELDNDKAFVTGKGGIMVYRSLQVDNFVFDTSASPDNTGTQIHVLRKGSGTDDYTVFTEQYNDMDIRVTQGTEDGTTYRFIIGNDNDGWSTRGSIPTDREWEDIGSAFRAGDRVKISNGHSSFDGIHVTDQTYYEAFFFPSGVTPTDGDYTAVDFEILPPVSDANGAFNSFRIPIIRVQADGDDTNLTSVANFNASSFDLTTGIAVGSDSSHANAGDWETGLYYNEPDIRVSVVPPYPYEIVNSDFEDIETELTKDQAGTGLSVVPGVIQLSGVSETSAATVLARTEVSNLTELVETIYAFRREINTDGERDNVLSESGTSRPDKEFITTDGSTITFNVDDVTLTTGGSDLIGYSTSNSDNGRLTIKCASTLTSGGTFDALSLTGTLTLTSVDLDGISVADENGVSVTVNLPDGVSSTYYKAEYGVGGPAGDNNITIHIGNPGESQNTGRFELYTVSPTTFNNQGVPTNGTVLASGDEWTDTTAIFVRSTNDQEFRGEDNFYLRYDADNWALYYLKNTIEDDVTNQHITLELTLADYAGSPNTTDGVFYTYSVSSGENDLTGYDRTIIAHAEETGSSISFSGSNAIPADTRFRMYVAPEGFDAQFIDRNTGANGFNITPTFIGYENALPETPSALIDAISSDYTYPSQDDDGILTITQDSSNSDLDGTLASDKTGDLLWGLLKSEGVADIALRKLRADSVHDSSGDRLFVRTQQTWDKDNALTSDTVTNIPLWSTPLDSETGSFTISLPKNTNTEKARWIFTFQNEVPTFDQAAVRTAAEEAILAQFGDDVTIDFDNISKDAKAAKINSAAGL